MTFKDRFSTEEWNLLREAAVMVSTGTENAHPSSLIGLLGETRAFINSVTSGQEVNPFINELGADESDLTFSAHLDDEDVKQWSPDERRTYTKARAIDIAGKASLVADAKLDPVDAAGYRRWLFAIAERVAEASREGFLGLFGQRVSEEEAVFLGELGAALRL